MYRFEIQLTVDGLTTHEVVEGTWESVVADYKEKGLFAITCLGEVV